ncbi:MAG: thiamine-phosphate kinase [Thermoproteota archaeon]|nr:thiamine-phosphate kinase [Candidatus Brockarchaeota archaeon]
MTRRILGERAIIDFIKKRFPQRGNILSPYDDAWACVLKNKYLISSGDMFVEVTDAPSFMNIRQMAFKSFTISVSDIASKGVPPTYYYLIIGLPRGFGKRELRELVEGWRDALRLYGGAIVGGDTNETSCITISVIVVSLSDKPPIARKGGKPGDIVAVTGFFGETYIGFKMMKNPDKIPKKIRKRVLEKICRPLARLREGIALNGVAEACTDSSDGLATSLYNLIRGCKNGILVEKLPLSEEVEEALSVIGASPLEAVFYGGEEFELVAVIPERKWNRAVEEVESIGGNLIPIGRIVEKKGVWYREGDRVTRVLERGWEHLT